MASRLTALKDTAPAAAAVTAAASVAPARAAKQAAQAAANEQRAQQNKSGDDLSPTLHSMAERLAHDHHKAL